MTVLQTPRLALRHLTPADAEFIFALTNDPDWLRFIGDRGIRTMDDARDYIENGPTAMYAEHGFGLYAVELKETGVPIGICGLLRRAWLEDADIGFAFLPQFRGAGYAYEAAENTLAHAHEMLGLARVLAIVSPDNEDSIRLLGKLGMKQERMAMPPGGSGEVAVYST